MLKYVQSFFNMEREHTIYLTSIGNLDVFPNNIPCKFVNHLSVPITFDPNYEYEIGRVSILYPNEYYAIVGNQYKNKITFYTKYLEISKIHTYSYIIKNNILASDIERLLYCINNEIKLRLMVYFDVHYGKVFGRGDIFWGDKYKKRVGVHYTGSPRSIEARRKGDIEHVTIAMGEGIADGLGFRTNSLYSIRGDDHEMISTISSTPVVLKVEVITPWG